MSDDEHNDACVKALHRMIKYIRDEAMRLHLMDVALLLDHAENVLLTFASDLRSEQGDGRSACGPLTVEH